MDSRRDTWLFHLRSQYGHLDNYVNLCVWHCFREQWDNYGVQLMWDFSSVITQSKPSKIILLYFLWNKSHMNLFSLSSCVRIVHLCRRRSDGAFVILKEIPVEQMSRDERLAAQNECQVLKLLNHPNIIEYYENFLEDKALMIAMEYAPGKLTVISYNVASFCSMRNTPLFSWSVAAGLHASSRSHVRPVNTTW